LTVSALLGALCGLSGLLSFAFFGATDPAVGTGFELLVIAAAVIGGTALSGGRGSVLGAALGALIVSVINGALTIFGVSVNYASFVTGVRIDESAPAISGSPEPGVYKIGNGPVTTSGSTCAGHLR
jgi:ribose transport system permease protein